LKAQGEASQGYGFFVEPEAVEAQRDDNRGFGFFVSPEPDVQAAQQVARQPKPSANRLQVQQERGRLARLLHKAKLQFVSASKKSTSSSIWLASW